MRVCVFGAGALGSAIGGLLAARNDVTLVGRRAHVDAIRRHGLALSGDVRRVVHLAAVETIALAEPPELLLIATKAFDTAKAVDECAGWAASSTKVLTLQNGLGNLEILRAWKGKGAFGGTTTFGATLLAPGRIRISGKGRTVIGSDKDPRFAVLLASIFSESGMPAATVEDVRSEVWSKVAVSSCINPISAVLRVNNGKLLASDWTRRLMDEVMKECVAVSSAEGVPLSHSKLSRRVRAVAKETSRNLSSMLQDVLRGKRTEISQINGEIAMLGAKHAIPTPLNDMLTAAVESIAPSGRTKG